VLRMGSMIVLARLLLPWDFGLVGMVTTFTGFLALFRDVGLSMATVQHATVSHDRSSTLFWINVGGGAILAGLCCVAAPVLVWFFGEPRLFWVAVVTGVGFIFNGAAVQHRAMLQRAMRFQAMVSIDTVSLVFSLAIAIASALAGGGYWAIVLMTISLPAAGAVGAWLATRWIPGPPRRGTGIRSMLWYGGIVTLNNVIVYLAYNTDKVLLGRFWGAEVLGIYGRAYQLINIPTENLNSTLGLVAFPALSRVQQDPIRLREYFLKGYAFLLAICVPIATACLLFAEDIVTVFLGPKWTEAAGMFRLLAPTILAFALINPLSWLMLAAGHAVRSLRIALLIAPIVMVGYAIGLAGGPKGVAVGFSAAMLLLVVPVVIWAKHGTSISTRDIGRAVMHPLLSTIAAGAGAYGVSGWTVYVDPVLLRLVVETGVFGAIYASVLLLVLNQKVKYLPMLREIGFWPRRQRGDQRVSG
jgi:O-antigen/teichoic acid export membrane protein